MDLSQVSAVLYSSGVQQPHHAEVYSSELRRTGDLRSRSEICCGIEPFQLDRNQVMTMDDY